MDLWIKIIIALVVIVCFTIVYRILYKMAFDHGFRYGYDNNPLLNKNQEDIHKSIKLLKSMTLYKHNRIIVNKVIQILEDVDVASTIIEDQTHKISIKIEFRKWLNKLKKIIIKWWWKGNG